MFIERREVRLKGEWWVNQWVTHRNVSSCSLDFKLTVFQLKNLIHSHKGLLVMSVLLDSY